ncbi:DUF1129 family protein [Salinibacillus xinjiangensis]|uniref:DUF1129 family protein n=1 Tax=Salinibacillus xinjiangensis TaxID=1229268 RepID=A0A6G1X7A4_9BACI|nr:DUF1129 family protein [Salinibacillus xinjiangensis]MRG86809.1 DUF1129 family protein [Salinibacillus xinjiangensis]
MDAKKLIELNNQKRKQLTKENETYYDDMLLYLRTHISLSEQQTEELLMELLDHLLEAQKQGKTAVEIFGTDSKSYCDEMVKQLPKEGFKNAAIFIGFLILQLIGWSGLGYGGTSFILEMFTDFNPSFYIGTGVVMVLVFLLSTALMIFCFFVWLKRSVYKKYTKVKNVFIGVGIGLIFFLSIFSIKFIPDFGYEIEKGNYLFLIGGGFIILLLKWINNKYRIIS